MAVRNLYGRQVKGGTLTRRLGQIVQPPPPPPPPGIAQDIDPTLYRPALDWKADYTTQAALIASYSGPNQDIKLSNTGTLTLVDDPLDGTRTQKWMRTDMPNGTATTNGVTDNPRMQIEDPRIILEGDGFWTGFSIIFPTNWPVPGTAGNGGFIQIYQLYGAPFGGGATITLTNRGNGTFDTPDGLRWGFNRDNADQAAGLAWRWQMQRLVRVDIAMRIVMGRTKETGSVEIWQNIGAGWKQQTLIGGVTRLGCVTLGTVNSTGPNSNEVQLYRPLDMELGTLHHFITGHARGSSLADVDPHSHDGTWDGTAPPPPPPPVFDLGVTRPTGDNVGAGRGGFSMPTIVIEGDVVLTGTMTLKNRIVNGRVICNGANLVENCIIRGPATAPTSGELWLVSCAGGTGSIIRNCNVSPRVQSPHLNGIGTKFYRAEYCNVWRCTDSFGAWSSAADGVTNVKILGCFSPNMTQFRPDILRGGSQRQETHNDTVQMQGNRAVAADILIEGCSFDATHGAAYAYPSGSPIVDNQLQLAAIMVTANTQPSSSGTIKNNWLMGGIYTVNAGADRNAGGFLIVTGNRFERPPGSNPTVARALVIDPGMNKTTSGNFYLNADGTTSSDAVTVTSG